MRSLIAFVVGAALLAGCSGPPVGLSAQQGSTILIPLGNAHVLGALGQIVGYTGSEYSDDQRGRMVFRLGGPTGDELITRGASVVVPPPSARASAELVSGFIFPRQLVFLVDIPTDAPLGTHDLYVERVAPGNPTPEPVFPAYLGEIKILPLNVSAGSETITGAETPFECLGSLPFCQANIKPFIAAVVPRPEIQFFLSSSGVSSLEMTVTYPSGTIDVLDAFQTLGAVPANRRGVVWYYDDGAGTLHVSAAATSSEHAIDAISVVFGLDSASSPLPENLAGVSATVTSATDEDGDPIVPLPTAGLNLY